MISSKANNIQNRLNFINRYSPLIWQHCLYEVASVRHLRHRRPSKKGLPDISRINWRRGHNKMSTKSKPNKFNSFSLELKFFPSFLEQNYISSEVVLIVKLIGFPRTCSCCISRKFTHFTKVTVLFRLRKIVRRVKWNARPCNFCIRVSCYIFLHENVTEC